MPGLINGHLVGDGWTWTYEGHVPLEDVQQLRQLVEAASPQELPDRCDSMIFCQLVDAFAHRVDGLMLRLVGNKLSNKLFVERYDGSSTPLIKLEKGEALPYCPTRSCLKSPRPL